MKQSTRIDLGRSYTSKEGRNIHLSKNKKQEGENTIHEGNFPELKSCKYTLTTAVPCHPQPRLCSLWAQSPRQPQSVQEQQSPFWRDSRRSAVASDHVTRLSHSPCFTMWAHDHFTPHKEGELAARGPESPTVTRLLSQHAVVTALFYY